MDAQTLFREGVQAIRDQKDVPRGRDLLLQAVQLDPQNEMAWLWLTHTVTDFRKRLDYVERALEINPSNPHALALRERLRAVIVAEPAAEPPPLAPPAPPAAPVPAPPVIRALPAKKPARPPLTKAQAEQVQRLVAQGEALRVAGNIEAAIEQWVEALKIMPDHEIALRNAAGHLWKLNYHDDAKELVWNALDSGTTSAAVYLTAIDIAEREQDHVKAQELREQAALLPDSDDGLIAAIADRYLQDFRSAEALDFLRRALVTHPKSQKLWNRLGDVYSEMGQTQQATQAYERAVRLGARHPEGREADRKLLEFVPVLSDRERTSLVLALREALGVAIFFLLLGWQDSGLNLLALGPRRWVGVLLSLLGGYLLVTATSSPQQRPLARWLGGQPDLAGSTAPIIPRAERWILGTAGAVILVLAFYMVFNHALDLVVHDPPPYLPWTNSY